MASKQAKIVKEDVSENTCVVCFKEVLIFSVGQCDHPVCFECSTRMRVLCRQNECPICRQDMPMVIFTQKVEPFDRIKNGKFLLDNKYKISFFTEAEKKAYDSLLAHVCSECGKESPNFGHLRDHVRRVHQLNFCDLCVENLKILTIERRCYSRKDLATHRRVGDPDDRSHRGHPLCEFCDKRYMDNEELYRHMRRDHLYCHFCDADGFHYYYKTYDSLREHYRNDHFLCEEGDCYVEKFTSVFRTEIDLKAHKASAHGKDLGKVGLKQARTLDIAFTLAPRPRPNRNNRYYNQPNSGGGGRDEDWEAPGAIGGAVAEEPPSSRGVEKPQQPPPAASQLNTNCIAEFPTLGGAAPAPPQTTLAPSANRKSASASVRARNHFSMDDFPALGPDGGGGPRAPPIRPVSAQTSGRPAAPAPSAVMTSVTMRVNTERSGTSSAAPSQTNLSIQVSSPRFTTTVTSQNTSYNIHFPALEGDGPVPAPPPAQPKANPSSALQWTTTSKKSKKSNETQTSASQLSKMKPLPKMDDFPALEPKSSKPLFPPSAPQKTSTASNTAPIKTITTEEGFSATKSKKKKSKSKAGAGNSIPIAAPTSSPKSKSAPQGSTAGSGGIGSGEPHKKSAAEKAYEKRALLYDGMVETEKSTIKQLDANIKMATAEEVELLRKSAAPVGKENQSQPNNQPVEVSDDSAFPALPGFGPPPPGFAPKWEVKKNPSGRPAQKAKAPPPGLGSTRPPPGLEPVAVVPPPGLEPVAAPNPPPGFTPANGAFPPLVTGGTFINPPNSDARNTALIGKISGALGAEALTDFKQVSYAFRSELITAAEYYSYCKEVMGDKKFLAIFPELLALLPDISKQQELWPNYQQDQQLFESASTKGNRLVACETCRQILRTSELREHLTRHSLDNNFPSLDKSLPAGKNAWAK